MSEHSPGSWRKVHADRTLIFAGRGETPIATIHLPQAQSAEEAKAIQQANARLIAAAPELLKALTELLEMGPECNPQWPAFDALPECPAGHEYECGACRVKRIARDAIAKATGE